MKKLLRLRALLPAVLLGLMHCSCTDVMEKEIGVQAHAGEIVKFPQNMITAMINSVTNGTRTLVLDLQITKDSQVVVFHDPCLSIMDVLYLNGRKISEGMETSLHICSMEYDTISKINAGVMQDLQSLKLKYEGSKIPLLTNLVDCIEAYTYSKGLPPIRYTIRINPRKESGVVDYKAYCDLSMKQLRKMKLSNRYCIQSSDTCVLNYMHYTYPVIPLSYEVNAKEYSVHDLLGRLDFIPSMISPLYGMIDDDFVSDAHYLRMKVIACGVNDRDEVLRLKKMGIDGIITSLPDSVRSWLVQDDHAQKYAEAVSFFECLMGY